MQTHGRFAGLIFALAIGSLPIAARAQAVTTDDGPGPPSPTAPTPPSPPTPPNPQYPPPQPGINQGYPPPNNPAYPPGYNQGYPPPNNPAYPPGYNQPYPPGYPQQYPYYYPYPPTPRTKLVYKQRPRWGLFAAGLGVFGGVYTFNVFYGGVLAGDNAFYVPLVGPAIFAGQYGNRPDCNAVFQNSFSSNCTTDSERRSVNALMVFDTLAQVTGATLMILGLVMKQKVAVSEPAVTVVPRFTPSSVGVAAVGRF